MLMQLQKSGGAHSSDNEICVTHTVCGPSHTPKKWSILWSFEVRPPHCTTGKSCHEKHPTENETKVKLLCSADHLSRLISGLSINRQHSMSSARADLDHVKSSMKEFEFAAKLLTIAAIKYDTFKLRAEFSALEHKYQIK